MYATIATLLTSAVDKVCTPTYDSTDETMAALFNRREYIKIRNERIRREKIANYLKATIATAAAVGEATLLVRTHRSRK